MNDNKVKISIGSLFIILLLVTLMIVGGTYALMKLTINVTNGIYNVATACFKVNYDAGEDIRGTLFPSRLPTGGLTGSVTVGLDPKCNVEGAGSLYLNINNNSSNASILTQIVAPHCEDSKTLETLTEYNTESKCNSKSGAKWVTTGTALKYAVYPRDVDEPISVGYINISNGKLNIYDGFELSESSVYDIYVWLDGNISDNSYQNISFGGDISAEVSQLEYHTAYAIYSETDNSLRFYNNGDTVNVGDTYRDRKVTAKFTEFENTPYYDQTRPWYDYRESITTVVVEEEIFPLNTKFWFYDFVNCSNLDLTKLNTSNVTSFESMFYNAGYNVAGEFEIMGLDKWDTSKVKYMTHVFNSAGYSAKKINFNLTNWNVSKVENMSSMFMNAGYNAISWNIGDLAKWDVSSTTSFRYMFTNAGHNAEVFDLGNLDRWNTSSVTDMSNVFTGAGYSAKTWTIGDLSDWNVSSVDTMYYMFMDAGYNATEWNIGDLSNWDTSKVTKMSRMFANVGCNALSFNLGNIGNWNTSSVEEMWGMFSNAGYNATTWTIGDLSNWNVSNVTSTSSMFSNAGYNATIWTIGDLSNWDTSSLIDANNMFDASGYNSTVFNIGNLSDWNVSKVENMSSMFSNSGYKATTWTIGDLSKWDTSNVAKISYMFFCAGYNATTFNIGDISSWNTSSVTDMSFMFYNTGKNATNWSLNLSNWNVSLVTNYKNFNFGVESKVTPPVWVTTSE